MKCGNLLKVARRVSFEKAAVSLFDLSGERAKIGSIYVSCYQLNIGIDDRRDGWPKLATLDLNYGRR
ncbi:hypothetical protein T10_1436 [Trichinella papuae]|uniref:Uncharacterized protein n=1 Tax=Trichinella papuae TaxID=268474 RepID=A0A0V1N4I3_9BILA|nr:hypothetical protein T10_1436 [Trichinella papuae]